MAYRWMRRHIRLALVVEQPDTNTASLTGAFARSEFFEPLPYTSIQQAEQALMAHDVEGIVWLRNDFSSRLLGSGNAPIGVFVNGVDANQARITEGYIQGVWQAWLSSYAREQGRELPVPVDARAAHLVQRRAAQPRLSGAWSDCGDHDTDRCHADLHGGCP